MKIFLKILHNMSQIVLDGTVRACMVLIWCLCAVLIVCSLLLLPTIILLTYHQRYQSSSFPVVIVAVTVTNTFYSNQKYCYYHS